jgi:hypothetical protein
VALRDDKKKTTMHGPVCQTRQVRRAKSDAPSHTTRAQLSAAG